MRASLDTTPDRVEVDPTMNSVVRYITTKVDDTLLAQLINKSLQPNIVKYTPNDSRKRFGNSQMFRLWQAKGREIYLLLGPGDDLAGIIWYGKASFPIAELELAETPQETFAIRLYEGYTGQGLAVPFMKQTLRLAVQRKQATNQPITGIWLQTDLSNAPARASYVKFGYEEVHQDKERITMVLSPTKILVICNHSQHPEQ